MIFELIGEDRGIKIYGRVDDDGLIRYTCTEDDSAYQAYLKSLEEGTIS